MIANTEANPAFKDVTTERLRDVVRSILVLRRWEIENLPINSSQVGFELFMSIVLQAASQDGSSFMLKRLYLSLPYSERGLRLHLRRLELGGWIRIESSDTDSRSSRLHVCQHTWDVAREYVHIFSRGIDCGEISKK